ncbi:MAG: hypothetical protein ACI4VL_00590 [Bacilli bacterium]
MISKELKEIIVHALRDFDNYELCYHLKNKYNIKELNNETIDNILNSRDGIDYLYHFFYELKDNEQLHYLNEIMVIDSKNYYNIEEKILPELKKSLVEQDKSKQKNNKDYER